MLTALARVVLGLLPWRLMALWQLRDVRFLDTPDPPEIFDHWASRKHVFADGRFTAWNHQFAVARGLFVDFTRCHGPKGGERIEDVPNQPESVEYHRFERGFFNLPKPIAYRLPFYLQQWMRSFATTVPDEVDCEHGNVHLALTRYEYANLYHVLTDLFNAFIVLRFLRIDPKSVTLILMDGHPASIMDTYYEAFFGDCRRLSEFRGVHRFETFVFSMANRQTTISPNLVGKETHLEAFREYTLDVFGVEPRRTVDVEKVTFVWRHDYLAHPRRPDGWVERKIANERELIDEARRRFSQLDVRGVVVDELSVAEQVRLMADTDIVIAMHGAALSYEFVMPDNSGILELFPVYHPPWDHYRNIALLRGLHYRRWENKDEALERPGKETIIPAEVVMDAIESLISSIEGRA